MSDLVTLSSYAEPENTAVVAAVGEIDLSNAPQLADALAAVNGAPHVVVDLTRCTFFDSSCLSVLALFCDGLSRARPGVQRARRCGGGGGFIELPTNLGELLGLDEPAGDRAR